MSTYEAPGMDPNFIYHHLNVNLTVVSKNQPHWRSSKEHAEAVKEEMMKVKRVGALKDGWPI